MGTHRSGFYPVCQLAESRSAVLRQQLDEAGDGPGQADDDPDQLARAEGGPTLPAPLEEVEPGLVGRGALLLDRDPLDVAPTGFVTWRPATGVPSVTKKREPVHVGATVACCVIVALPIAIVSSPPCT